MTTQYDNLIEQTANTLVTEDVRWEQIKQEGLNMCKRLYLDQPSTQEVLHLLSQAWEYGAEHGTKNLMTQKQV